MSCIICESATEHYLGDFVPFLKERMFKNPGIKTDLVYCPNCKFYYSSTRPIDEEMSRFYTGYRDDNYQKQRKKMKIIILQNSTLI